MGRQGHKAKLGMAIEKAVLKVGLSGLLSGLLSVSVPATLLLMTCSRLASAGLWLCTHTSRGCACIRSNLTPMPPGPCAPAGTLSPPPRELDGGWGLNIHKRLVAPENKYYRGVQATVCK